MKIEAGDCLGYGVRGWRSYFTHPFEQLVQTKTWSDLYHVEVYVGGEQSISADYRGVNVFPVNLEVERLYCVLRPRWAWSLMNAFAWFNREARGQHYDPLGLLRFYRITTPGYGYICSELAALFYRMGGLHVFNEVHAKAVSPGMFLAEDAFERVWTRGDDR